MNIEILYGPSNTAAKVNLDAGDTMTTESGSMIAMSQGIDLQTTTHKKGKGSLLKSIKRLFAGESFFLNHYTAHSQGEVYLSSILPGDMAQVELSGENIIVQSSSFLACDEGVSMDVGWQGFKSIFSGESLFWLNLKGEGVVLLNAFGAIYPVEVDGEYTVDTGHIVAFDETLKFSISKAGSSWLHSFMGGEGLVCRFKGKGRIWCQSHDAKGFGKKLRPYLKVKRTN
ncbi:MAG: TIGR00266 family protein [Bdellovibrionaceae bacterium]|jgi:uncharacterized protein (TIGR00266 family)|nr:TIGR00266 family protein [Pseudobdellovibrionaceae bacterium]